MFCWQDHSFPHYKEGNAKKLAHACLKLIGRSSVMPAIIQKGNCVFMLKVFYFFYLRCQALKMVNMT